jgi:hypothetical protein
VRAGPGSEAGGAGSSGAFGHMVTAFVAHLDKRRRPLA